MDSVLWPKEKETISCEGVIHDISEMNHLKPRPRFAV